MALDWFNQLAANRAVARSGGSEPVSEVNPSAATATAEIGIDISQEFPKPWVEELVLAADVVVTMGCGDACHSCGPLGTDPETIHKLGKRYWL